MEINYLVYKVKTVNGTGWLFSPELPENPYFDVDEAIRQLKCFCAQKEANGCIISSVTEICANASSTPRVAFRDKEYHQMLNEAIKHKDDPKQNTGAGTSEKTRFEHDGRQYCMTEEEIEAAYRYQLRQYLLEEAKSHFFIYVFGLDDGSDFDDPEDKVRKAEFEEEHGVSYEEACSEKMLDKYIHGFTDNFDSGLPAMNIWQDAIKQALAKTREEG